MSIESKVVNAITNIEDKVNDVSTHPLKNKWITIIGDAFCSYSGWCYANAFYPYPYPNCGFSTVEGMWWHQLIKNTGAKLCRLAVGPGWDVTQQNYTFSSEESDPYDWYINNGSTYKDIDGNNHTAGETIYPDVIIIMTGGSSNKNGATRPIYELGNKYQEIPPVMTYENYFDTNNGSWKGHYHTLIQRLFTQIHSQHKHIQIFLCDPTFYYYSSGYDPRHQDKRYQMSKAIDDICEYWNLARIPTMTYIIGGNYGSGSDTVAVNGGGSSTFYLPNLQGMARLAKGIESYLSILVHPNYSIDGNNPVIEDTEDPNNPNLNEEPTIYPADDLDEFMADEGDIPVSPGS